MPDRLGGDGWLHRQDGREDEAPHDMSSGLDEAENLANTHDDIEAHLPYL
jgi:hypothetical protein